jgi:putative ABC transport system substrate-binding protein
MINKNNKFYKLSKIVVTYYILPLLLLTSFYISTVTAGEKTVTIIQSQQIAAYNEAVKGFKEECRGKNITIKKIYNLKGDIEEGKKTVQDIKANKPNLILAVGVLAATLVKEQFPEIPIIFCMVVNHYRFNLQGDNITGISVEASVEDQFIILRNLLGEHKNLGVIYDITKTGKIISEAETIAKTIGFNLIKSEVTSEKEVIHVLEDIIKKIEALWIIPDSTVITKNTLEAIFRIALDHHLPTFCTSEAIVKTGALISISPDYTYTGLQAAKIAQILINNPGTTSMGIKNPEKLRLTLNTQTAESVGINLTTFQSYPNIILYP